MVWVPARNLVPKPESMTFVEAACLPTAWLTAYKMLVRKGQVQAGNAVLVQAQAVASRRPLWCWRKR